MIGQDIRQRLAVEARKIEPAAVVFDLGKQIAACEAQRDLDIAVAAAVANGIGGGLLNTEHDIVDDLPLGAELVQVVANALAGTQQVGRLWGERGSAGAVARSVKLACYPTTGSP